MCVEVAADDGTRVLLDLGMPLYDANHNDYPFGTPQRPTAELLASGVLCDIPGLYASDQTAPNYAAIVVTHSHLDHYGLAHHAHSAVPVYASRGTLAIFEVSKIFFPDAVLPADVRLLPDDESLRFGALTVTGIPVDHSAPDARALLVEGDGQKLIYSGDLRAHGRTGFRFEKLLADQRLRGADWLLLEGTTLGAGGDSHGLRSEQEVEEALVALATGGPDKAVVVVASGQNLDRLVSCYRAAKRTGRKLVVDPYQAFVLQKLAPLSENIPQFTWDDVRVNFTHHQVEKLKAAGLMELAHEMGRAARVSTYALGAHAGSYLLCARGSWRTTQLLNRIGAANAELVWSMWGGYWNRDNCAVRIWAERAGVQAHFIHSGGHAWPADLERLMEALSARETIWVHTDRSADADDSEGQTALP